MTVIRIAARTFMAAIFVRSGYEAMRHPEHLAEHAKPVTDRIAPVIESIHPSLPTDATTLVRLNGAAHFVGGIMLATGVGSRPAAAMLAGTLVPTTVAGHPFWKHGDPEQRQAQMTHTLKNVGLIGGLLLASVDTEGRPSVAWRTSDLARRTGRSAQRTARRTKRGGQRAARTAARETRLAVRSAKVGRLAEKARELLPG
jgi:uncharacterized membrane protein YphA (DoxX/SURF4 family)